MNKIIITVITFILIFTSTIANGAESYDGSKYIEFGEDTKTGNVTYLKTDTISKEYNKSIGEYYSFWMLVSNRINLNKYSHFKVAISGDGKKYQIHRQIDDMARDTGTDYPDDSSWKESSSSDDIPIAGIYDYIKGHYFMIY